MRTTLDIDDDLLAAAKELARRQGRSAGQVVSALMRQSLTGSVSRSEGCKPGSISPVVAGFRPFAARPGVVVTDDHVNALREAEGI